MACNRPMPARLFILLILFPHLLTAEEEATGVQLGLVSEVRSIAPGHAFVVGLHIRHDAHYHTYWQNPGIVGVATGIAWELPEGFVAGPIQWPYPERVDMAGHPAHGYEREVLLMVAITPPAEIVAKEVVLSAKLSWMACAKECHPGFATRSLRLPVGAKPAADPGTAELFAAARSELPATKSDWAVSLDPRTKGDDIVLTLEKTSGPSRVPRSGYFYSADGQVSSDQEQVLVSDGAGRYRLTLKRSRFGPQEARRLSGVLEIDGQRCRVSLPLNYREQSPPRTP